MPMSRSTWDCHNIALRAYRPLCLCRNDSLALDKMQNLVFLVKVGARARAHAKANHQEFQLLAVFASYLHARAYVLSEG